MRSAIVESGVVVNVINGSIPGSIACDDTVSKGWTYDGSTFSAPVVAGPTLTEKRAAAVLTRDQFLIGCVGAGIITEAVAEEAAGGAWPAAFNVFLAGLTAAQRITAKATWADGGNVRRDNDILALIAADQSVDEAQLDTLFGIS